MPEVCGCLQSAFPDARGLPVDLDQSGRDALPAEFYSAKIEGLPDMVDTLTARCLDRSSLAFLVIPPITWRLLHCTHDKERSEHDREPSQHPRRPVARLSRDLRKSRGRDEQCGAGRWCGCRHRVCGVGTANDSSGWQSGTNIVLAGVLLVLAVVRWAIGVAPLVSFWIILLAGIAVGIASMWSMLYRPETAQPRASS